MPTLIPRLRRGRRSLLVIVLVATALACLLVYGRDSEQHRPVPVHIDTRQNVDQPKQSINQFKQPLVPFTSEELRYIKYGEGESLVSADDERYLNYIRTFMARPSLNAPRELKDKSGRTHFSQAGQSKFVDNRLGKRRNGFFMECGAVDGETLSNSLFFELDRNWTGLLVEANPEYYKTLLTKNRQAYAMSGCLSPTNRPGSLTFRPAGVFGGLGDSMEKTHADFVDKRRDGKSVVTVQCFPLPDVLLALGVNKVDYLSLDVEGPEVDILRTLDLTKVRVDILTIEYRVITPVPRVKVDIEATEKKLEDLRAYFTSTGLYREVTTLNMLDVVFERTDLVTNDG